MTEPKGVTARPILFSGDMVRAILDGRKTQTRRVVSFSNSYFDGHRGLRKCWDELVWDDTVFVDPGPSPAGNAGPYLKVPRPSMGTRHRIYPIWGPGDLLWVREAFALVGGWDPGTALYREGWQDQVRLLRMENADVAPRWTPSIHMPRWASRLTLEITDVRVQRVREISEEDAMAEGIWHPAGPAGEHLWLPCAEDGKAHINQCLAFRDLWDSLNAARGFGWAANPWVWALTFKVHRCNVDQMPRNSQ